MKLFGLLNCSAFFGGLQRDTDLLLADNLCGAKLLAASSRFRRRRRCSVNSVCRRSLIARAEMTVVVGRHGQHRQSNGGTGTGSSDIGVNIALELGGGLVISVRIDMDPRIVIGQRSCPSPSRKSCC